MKFSIEKIVNEKIKNWSKDKCPIYKIYGIPAGDKVPLQIFIFYKKDKDLQTNIASGLVEQTKTAFIRILDEVGYFKKHPHDVTFEFDSHQNIKKNYKGSYFFRLR